MSKEKWLIRENLKSFREQALLIWKEICNKQNKKVDLLNKQRKLQGELRVVGRELNRTFELLQSLQKDYNKTLAKGFDVPVIDLNGKEIEK